MMNSCFARTTLLGLSLIASMASAKPFQSLDTIQAEFTAKNSSRYLSATAKLNYANDTLNLALAPACPKDEECEAAEVIEYTFESVNSTVNSCGVVTSVALIDQIPVDGIRTEVTLIDNSQYRCRGRKPAAVMSVKQKWYNRLQGRWLQISDSFKADTVETVVAFQGVISADLNSVTSQAFIGGHVFLDGRNNFVELTLTPVMPECPKDMMCIQKMPEPKTYTFENAKTEINDCGIISTVASFNDRPLGGISMKVTITNNSNNTCPTFAPLNTLDVIVEKTEDVVTVDLLKADEIALIKPGK
jgi:hypothetical protein